ncbi:MAG: MASE1 domain-containing protein [Burkholderiales bacterium]
MVLRAVLYGAAYFACAEASRLLSVPGSTYISYWLPAGLGIAVFVLCASREWPLLAAAGFAANIAFDTIQGTAPSVAVLFGAINALQALGGAWLVRRFVSARPTLATLKEFLGLMALAAGVSAAAGAALASAVLVSFGLSTAFWQSWQVWWGSNAAAILLLAPFILAWYAMPRAAGRRLLRPGRLLEAGLLLAILLALTGYLLFEGPGIMSPGKGYLMAPLLWAALRFGTAGAASANLLMSVLVTFFTTQWHAGLVAADVASGDYVYVTQAALAAVALLSLIPAIVLGERDARIAELREMARRLVEVQEEERRSINRELHDRVGQNLSALQLNLGVLDTELSGGVAPAQKLRLDDARALIESTSRQVRDVMAELRPAALDEYGLLAALRHHCAALSVRAGIAIEVVGEEPEPRLALAIETALFRVAQEALNNIVKHARARRAVLTLRAAPRLAKLTIADDGVGFDPARPAPGASYGIATMRERAAAVDARLRIDSVPGSGTRVEVAVDRAAA